MSRVFFCDNCKLSKDPIGIAPAKKAWILIRNNSSSINSAKPPFQVNWIRPLNWIFLLLLLLFQSCFNKLEQQCIGEYNIENYNNSSKYFTLKLDIDHKFEIKNNKIITIGTWKVKDTSDFVIVELVEEKTNKFHQFIYGKNSLLVLNPHFLIDTSSTARITLIKND